VKEPNCVTTIAYRDGVMACDSKASEGHLFVTKYKKVERLSNGALWGSAGDCDTREVDKLLAKASPERMPTRAQLAKTSTSMHGLLVFPGGKVFGIYIYQVGEHTDEWTAQVLEIVEPFCAVGSGGELALAAMAAGASAGDAVRIACKYDAYSGEPVHEHRLVERKRRGNERSK
jgi:ATP-dependent protease HslVU (ClpYQ) peptidase subunit